MSTKNPTASLALVVAALGVIAIVLATAAFTVRETEYAIKFQFSKIVSSESSPGLHFKIPFIESVRRFDRRVLTRSYPAEQFLTSEGKILRIDFYMKWRIENVERYYQATTGEETVAASRLGEIVKDGLKGVIARRTLQQVVSAERSEFIDGMLATVAANASQLGVTVVDVRVKRIDLPDEVSESVFNRMRENFRLQAAQLRAEGEENKERLRAEADRQRVEILAEAYRQAESVRGEGDAKAAETYARAFGRSPEFYGFYRSMQAYRDSIGQDSDVLVISPDSEFFKYLKQPSGR